MSIQSGLVHWCNTCTVSMYMTPTLSELVHAPLILINLLSDSLVHVPPILQAREQIQQAGFPPAGRIIVLLQARLKVQLPTTCCGLLQCKQLLVCFLSARLSPGQVVPIATYLP